MEPSFTLRPRQLTLKPSVMRSGECDSFLALMVELKLNFLVFVVKIIPYRHIYFGLPNTCFSFLFPYVYGILPGCMSVYHICAW